MYVYDEETGALYVEYGDHVARVEDPEVTATHVVDHVRKFYEEARGSGGAPWQMGETR